MNILFVGSLAAAVAFSPAVALHAQSADSASAERGARPGQQEIAPAQGDDSTWSIVSGLRITEVAAGGTLIRLRDGTTWEVYLPDRPNTVAWRSGDFVMVKLSPIAHGDYNYTLLNGRAQSTAEVRFRGKEE